MRIRATDRTIRQLLNGPRYTIEYYQRNYNWATKQITDLIDDLTVRFFSQYAPDHDRADVAQYDGYYLGSIITNDDKGTRAIVDGQQRLTSITLLLITLHHRLLNQSHDSPLHDLIFSTQFGRETLTIHVPERELYIRGIVTHPPQIAEDLSDEMRNLHDRFSDIRDILAGTLPDEAVPHFTDWLLDRVVLVEIETDSDDDAYTIFVTMNDRGLSLTPTELLKGYLLTNITGEGERERAEDHWNDRISALNALSNKGDADSDAITAWLRAQHAETIRPNEQGAQPGDFERISTGFHRWIEPNTSTKLELTDSEHFYDFITRRFDFFSRRYADIFTATLGDNRELEAARYIADHNFTLQYPVLLAPLMVDDSPSVVRRKLRVTAAFLDIMIHRRLWNSRSIAFNTMRNAMFNVIKEIRNSSLDDLVNVLGERLAAESETFAANASFGLNQRNRPAVRRILARLTDHVEVESERQSRYAELLTSGKSGFDIEHIWADRFEEHHSEFDHERDFQDARNMLGGLILIESSPNRSLGSLSYDEKLEYYDSQNLLARSLYHRAYEHHPAFRRFINRTEMPFKAHKEFRTSDLRERQQLYTRLAEEIWNPERLGREASTQ